MGRRKDARKSPPEPELKIPFQHLPGLTDDKL